jgi:AcrR family transcriptional regulator
MTTRENMILERRPPSCSPDSGYPSTSMNQVAEACGLSKATLYHYYRDK